MTRENKKFIAILVLSIARIIFQGLRDIPKMILIMGFIFLLFAPPSAWMAVNQIWYQLRPLTDSEAVMLGKSISGLLLFAWLLTAGIRFIISLDDILSLLKEIKYER